MKLLTAVSIASLSTAFVLPPQDVISEIAIEDNHRGNGWLDEAVKEKDEVLSGFKKHYEEVEETSKDAWSTLYESSKSALDQVLEYTTETVDSIKDTAFDMESWLRTEADDLYNSFDDPHDGPPHHSPPHHGPGHRPAHPPQHGKPNQTVYQLISESKYTTKLAKLINKYDDLVETLNSTKANYTV